MAKVALYVRTSTDKQTTGAEAQERALVEHCQKHEIDSYEIFKDEGYSGSKSSRPALDQLLKRAGEFDQVICYSFSRFARSTKHLLEALEFFQNNNIRFISVSEKLDMATPHGKLVFTILASVSELERELIRERVINGLANARAKGKQLGRPSNANKKLIMQLGEQGLTYKEIAEYANCSTATVSRLLRRQVSKYMVSNF